MGSMGAGCPECEQSRRQCGSHTGHTSYRRCGTAFSGFCGSPRCTGKNQRPDDPPEGNDAPPEMDNCCGRCSYICGYTRHACRQYSHGGHTESIPCTRSYSR
ncbi:hypothetical protein AMQ83_20495 [Paenibacillus riograndensis]|nr:hypothetical protein AMQ83_20495 [Paenibacillus riograndensis]